ncbi:hypothetical protein BJ741DRAFT_552596 [Chytriomyces cf. hyalinus JEL632]|nr:hypothetical protein BJ741DRAFT_552596 [Chytriomyces cf. hyalinus JEL632]
MPANQTKAPKRIAVIGSGVSGLSAAWLLSQHTPFETRVSLFESGDYFGGHSHTVDLHSLDNSETVGVDTGFIVCNPITYPNLLAFLECLNVPLQPSDMSFAVSRNGGAFEWNGNNTNTLFAQRENIFNPDMWKMVSQVLRFNEQADKIAREADDLEFDRNGNVREDAKAHPYAKMTLGEFFEQFGYSKFFYQNYIVPMTAAIWSTPANMTFDKFPLLTLVRFMRNHILLQVDNRPKWMTVDGGSRKYVEKVISQLADTRLNTRITRVKRSLADGTVTLTDSYGKTEVFDHVIFATHSDQALAILGDDATEDERAILGSIKFLNNRAILHRDEKLMPKRKLAWASWSYLTEISNETDSQSMCLTYWMDNLQPHIDPRKFGNVFVTMNPLFEPEASKVVAEYEYTHPLYSPETIAAQDSLNTIQNNNLTTFAGAWTNYGFHEDGLTSGLLAATSLGAICPFEISLNGGYPTRRVPPSPPAWAVKEFGIKQYVPAKPRFATDEARQAFLKNVLENHSIVGKKKQGGSNGGLGMATVMSAAVLVVAIASAVFYFK